MSVASRVAPRQRSALTLSAVRVGPGPSNKGIFIRINRDGPGKGEARLVPVVEARHLQSQEYQITHPQAQVNGILKGAFYGTISDQISITCRGGTDTKGKGKLRALLDYKDEVRHPPGPRKRRLTVAVLDRQTTFRARRCHLPLYTRQCGRGRVCQAQAGAQQQSRGRD